MIHSLIGAVWLCMHEGVAAAHRLLVADVDLGVRELVGRLRHQVGAEQLGDLLGKLGCARPLKTIRFFSVVRFMPVTLCVAPGSVGLRRGVSPPILRAGSSTAVGSGGAAAASACAVPARSRGRPALEVALRAAR